MGNTTAIEWCDATFNPWWGCTRISPACDHCYAAALSKRYGHDVWDNGQRRTFGDKHWNEPLKWARTMPEKLGRRPRVFCASMADVFDKDAPDGERERLWSLIEATPELDWLLLTKRVGNVYRFVPMWVDGGWPAHVWLGSTIANQEEADRDIPKLLAIPAAVRFLSCEPLLGPLNVRGYLMQGENPAQCGNCGKGHGFTRCPNYGGIAKESDRHGCKAFKRVNFEIDWVIAGGESGPKARPSHPDWHRALRDQCEAAGVPFLFKQWGEWWEAASDWRDADGAHVQVGVGTIEADEAFERGDLLIAPDGRTFDSPDAIPDDVPCRLVTRLGKRAAGRELDGRTHDGYPA